MFQILKANRICKKGNRIKQKKKYPSNLNRVIQFAVGPFILTINPRSAAMRKIRNPLIKKKSRD